MNLTRLKSVFDKESVDNSHYALRKHLVTKDRRRRALHEGRT